MRIAYVANNILAPSHLWMRRMLEGMGDAVALLATNSDPGPEYKTRYRWLSTAPTITDRFLDRMHLHVGDFHARLRLRSAIRFNNVSAILVHYATLAVKLAPLWRTIKKPVWVHCHGYDVTWDMRAQDADRKRTHPEGYVEQVKNLPENVRFIANSQETKRRLLAIGIDDHRIQVKYLGVEMPPEPPSELRASKTPRFLYLGRLVDCKGPDLVIRAFEQACDDGMDGTLTLAGDGPLRLTCELMRARSPHADRITIAGAVDRQMGERLRNEADIFCAHNCLGPISLQEEAFGVSFIEAMASGLPVVSARSGSLPEVVEDGKQGILVEPGDVRGQATAFIRLANDPLLRSRMGREGWERARRLFSVRQEIDRLREILSLP